MNKTKIGCVEDTLKLRKHWVDELNKYDDFEVIFEAEDEIELREYLETGLLPDFLILDLRLHGEPAGLDVLKYIAENKLKINVIVCSNFTDDGIIVQCLELGAKCFTLKGVPSDITKAIRMVQQENIFVTEDALQALLTINGQLRRKADEWKAKGPQGAHPATMPKLDDEQLRMLKYLCSALTYKEIADRENMTEKEVERRRDRLCVIFDALNRYDLIYKATKLGLDRQM